MPTAAAAFLLRPARPWGSAVLWKPAGKVGGAGRPGNRPTPVALVGFSARVLSNTRPQSRGRAQTARVPSFLSLSEILERTPRMLASTRSSSREATRLFFLCHLRQTFAHTCFTSNAIWLVCSQVGLASRTRPCKPAPRPQNRRRWRSRVPLVCLPFSALPRQVTAVLADDSLG